MPTFTLNILLHTYWHVYMLHIEYIYTRMQTESELKKHELRVIYIIAEKNCTIF